MTFPSYFPNFHDFFDDASLLTPKPKREIKRLVEKTESHILIGLLNRFVRTVPQDGSQTIHTSFSSTFSSTFSAAGAAAPPAEAPPAGAAPPAPPDGTEASFWDPSAINCIEPSALGPGKIFNAESDIPR